MRLSNAFRCAALFFTVSAFADDPLLVIDAGGHNATIRSVIFTSDSQSLISAGVDKVVRVWDVKTGRTIRSLRGQIGTGPDGIIYAAALSPNNRYLAVAGFLAGNVIRIFDLHSGEVAAVLAGHKNTIACLAYSPDGRLASGDALGSIRLWDASKMSLIRDLTGHAGSVQSLSFSKDGSLLASAGADRIVRLWDAHNGKTVKQLSGHANIISSAVFSPDGRFLASVSIDGALRYWDTQTGALLKNLEGALPKPANLAFTPDGAHLLGTSANASRYLAYILSVPDGSVTSTLRTHDSLITAVAISPDGKIAATAGGSRNQIYLWSVASGLPGNTLVGKGHMIRSVGFAKDGRSIAFGEERAAQPATNSYGPLERIFWLNKDAGQYHLSLGGLAADADYFTARELVGNRSLRLAPRPSGPPDDTALQVLDGGRMVQEFQREQTTGYHHLCYTLTQDGRIISGGANGQLALFTADSSSSKFKFVGHTGSVWAVAVSPDGRTLVSGSDDQTVRLWDIATQNNLLTLFVGSDDEWVAWTPQGYYASSINGDRYVGWHLNQGPGKAAKYWSVAQFQNEFYRPDVVAELLKDRNLDVAKRTADRSRGRPEQPVAGPADVAASVPPVVVIISPDQDNVVIDGDTYTVKAAAVSNTNLPVSEIRVLVNDSQVLHLAPNAARKEISLDVKLQKGLNTIKIFAANSKATAEPEVRRITSKSAPAAPKPNLFLLAIGISKYENDSMALHFADRDAIDLADTYSKQKGRSLFNEIMTRVLPNDKATRENIIMALDWLSKAGTPNDLRMLFLSGHGELIDGDYYYCSYQYKPGSPPDLHGVLWKTVLKNLTNIPGKAVLMVDTCHAAAISGSAARGVTPVDTTELIKQFNKFPGLVVYAAATRQESSFENPSWGHGAFTMALLEGLLGKAKAENSMIRTQELGQWLINRVPEITKTTQHAVVSTNPDDLLPFPIFAIQ